MGKSRCALSYGCSQQAFRGYQEVVGRQSGQCYCFASGQNFCGEMDFFWNEVSSEDDLGQKFRFQIDAKTSWLQRSLLSPNFLAYLVHLSLFEKLTHYLIANILRWEFLACHYGSVLARGQSHQTLVFCVVRSKAARRPRNEPADTQGYREDCQETSQIESESYYSGNWETRVVQQRGRR